MIDFSLLSNYIESATEISKNDSGISLVKSDIDMINMDKFKDVEGITAKSVDAIKIKQTEKGNVLFLIEFKGGLTPNDWSAETLDLKALDTLLCILPHKFGLEDVLELMKKWAIIYVVICSTENKIFSSRSNNAVNQRHMRGLVNYTGEIKFNLKKYKGRKPFSNIITETAEVFEKVLQHYL